MSSTEETLEGRGGVKLFSRAWRPEGAPRGVLLVVPGFNSHSDYYGAVAERWAARGLAVSAIDLRGRGKSEGERFFVETFDEYVSDVAALAARARERDPGLPVFLLGHSAGGVVACLYALEHQAELAGLVCESFAFRLPAPDFALAVMKGLSHVAPHFHALKLPNETFSRDPAVVARMNADPLIAGESQPLETMAALVRADERLQRELPQLTLPLLVLHGSLDVDAKPAGSQHLYEVASSTDKTLKLYEGHVHDLLNDVGKEIVIADIEAFIDRVLPVAGT